MLKTNGTEEKELFENIRVVCPTCNKSKELKIPSKIINQSKQLTTVSIPSGAVCEHSFQSFVDKNFKVRGYQKVDFEFAHMEFYEGGGDSLETSVEDHISTMTSSHLFQEIVKILRNFVDDREILGSGIFTTDGNVLYSSLPSTTLFSITKEFEVRSEKKLSALKKMYLELENNQKICSSYIDIQDKRFAVVLFFSHLVKLGMGNLYLNDLVRKIKSLEN
ncbi:MAG: hypothetical protein ACFFA3_07450 [Promethearchaeota archaeon]